MTYAPPALSCTTHSSLSDSRLETPSAARDKGAGRLSVIARAAPRASLDIILPYVINFFHMEGSIENINPAESGDRLLATLAAIANPHRLRILAALTGGANYVSQLARELQISRPLLYLHLQRLEAVGLVKGHLELSDEGKAMKYFEVVPFQLQLDPATIRQAVETLTTGESE